MHASVSAPTPYSSWSVDMAASSKASRVAPPSPAAEPRCMLLLLLLRAGGHATQWRRAGAASLPRWCMLPSRTAFFFWGGAWICYNGGREGTRKTWQQLCSTLPAQERNPGTLNWRPRTQTPRPTRQHPEDEINPQERQGEPRLTNPREERKGMGKRTRGCKGQREETTAYRQAREQALAG